MKNRMIAIAAIAAGLSLAPVAALAAPSSPARSTSGTTTAPSTSTPNPASAASTSTKSTSPTTASSSTTASTARTATKAARYEVVSGTYSSSARAEKHLSAVVAKGITGLTVHEFKVPSTRYRVEERGLTRAAASTKVKALHAAHLAGFFFRRA